MIKTTLLLVLSTLPLLAAAQQQAIWRCGSSYSAAPCSEGRALEAAQPRPDADVLAASRMAGREQHLADSLRHERLQREAAASRQGAIGIYAPVSLASKSKPTTAGKLKKPAHRSQRSEDADTWRATALPTRRAKG